MKKWTFVLATITFIVFVLIAININSDAVNDLDEWAASILKGNETIGAFHYIGETVWVIVVSVALLAFLWIKGRIYRAMAFVLLTIAGGCILNQAAKAYFQRPRPDIVNQLESFSFPSGHSMLSILYLLTVAFIFAQMTATKWKKVILFVVAVVLTILIGFSRVAESRHFISDVFAGWSLGFTWFVLCAWWYEKQQHTKKK